MDTEASSEYDMSFTTFGRINFEFWNLNNAKREDNIHLMFRAIKNLHSESISAGLRKKQKEHYLKIKKECEEEYKNYMNILENYNLSRQEANIIFNPPIGKLLELLDQWEECLRDVLENITIRKGTDAAYIMR